MNLIKIESINNCNVVDSRLIAKELDIAHKSFLETIRKYETQLQAFGQLPFKTETVTNSVGATNTAVFVYLSEEQATFVMSLSRNTEKVVNCKFKLVKAFSLAKKTIKDSLDNISRLDLARMLVASEEQNEQQQKQLEEQKPLVAFAEAIQFSDDSVDFNSYAKTIGLGRNKMMAKLRDIGVLMKNSTLPYQKWIDAGYFECSQEILGNGKIVPFALVTGKGQIWLKQRIDHYDNLARKTVKAIEQGTLGSMI